jgi:hypothetical protein
MMNREQGTQMSELNEQIKLNEQSTKKKLFSRWETINIPGLLCVAYLSRYEWHRFLIRLIICLYKQAKCA